MSNILILPTQRADLEYIGDRLRDADRTEFFASCGKRPEDAFVTRTAPSAQYTAFVDDLPAAVFGCTDAGLYGAPWLLGTDAIEGRKVAYMMVSLGRTFFQSWAEKYICLRNYTYAHNHLHHKFIRLLGAELSDKITPVGPYGAPFKEFTYSV